MKIDYSNIDYNVAHLIDQYVGCPIEYADQDDSSDHMRLISLGYIQGVIDMGKAMKEVLQS